MKVIHAEVKARYGSPRVHAELVAKGHECSGNFVAQVLREAGIAAKTRTSRLVVDALEMALTRRRPLKGSSSSALVAHSDRGSQYASEHYQRRLSEERITCSMSRRGDCWDNAPMESFFASLKKELVHHEDYATRDQARASIFEYIEAFYNRVRRHSALGYVAPAEYERTHNPTHR